VSRYVARRRVERDLVSKDVFVPQTHPRGAEAEVDFGEFDTTIAGSTVRLWMFVMRLSHSGRAFHVAYGTHAGAGGVPAGPCRGVRPLRWGSRPGVESR